MTRPEYAKKQSTSVKEDHGRKKEGENLPLDDEARTPTVDLVEGGEEETGDGGQEDSVRPDRKEEDGAQPGDGAFGVAPVAQECVALRSIDADESILEGRFPFSLVASGTPSR